MELSMANRKTLSYSNMSSSFKHTPSPPLVPLVPISPTSAQAFQSHFLRATPSLSSYQNYNPNQQYLPHHQNNPHQGHPFFSGVNKISVISLERRIDYHLQRIMKQNRLINFKNSIEGLEIDNRINESLLEIIASSNNLIHRRQTLIQSGMALLAKLQTYYESGSHAEAFNLMAHSFAELKQISSNLGQLIWALNSNKEHIKYVIKVFALPEVYTRPGPDLEHIPLKERIVQMITYCEDTIERCQALKNHFHDVIIQIFLTKYQR